MVFSLFGTLAMTVGQWFGSNLYLILSNVGIFIFVSSLSFVVVQVNKDLESAVQLNTFLHAFDDLRATHVQHYQDYQQQEQDNDDTQVVIVDERHEVAHGDDISVHEHKVVEKKNGKLEMKQDKIKLKKGKVVEFAEETTEIVSRSSSPTS